MQLHICLSFIASYFCIICTCLLQLIYYYESFSIPIVSSILFFVITVLSNNSFLLFSLHYFHPTSICCQLFASVFMFMLMPTVLTCSFQTSNLVLQAGKVPRPYCSPFRFPFTNLHFHYSCHSSYPLSHNICFSLLVAPDNYLHYFKSFKTYVSKILQA